MADMARGKWRGILLALGADERHLTGKHGPCPFCEGVDRFRWDNQAGKGTFICGVCGAGDGFEYLKRLKGWDFKRAAKEVEGVIGGASAEPVRKPIDEAKRVEMLNKLWASASSLEPGDMAVNYLSSRGIIIDRHPACIRFHHACPIPYQGGYGPAMIAMVSDVDGKPVNIHRTFLGPNGKADMENPRAMMPGPVPDGAAVRLFPVHGERLGIAEGIETAWRASMRFGLPVWAAINATMMAKWTPPVGVKEVVIFGDNDPLFGGQAATFALAHNLAARKRLMVTPMIPGTVGRDWADEDAA